jgi:hypothetical protein
MPSPKQLAKALSRQDSVTKQPRNRFLGAVADAAGYLSDQADRYVVPERDPLFGGMRGGDLLPLRNVNRLLDDLSYGGRITTGRGQTTTLRPEVVDTVALGGAMRPFIQKGGEAALKTLAEQVQNKTGFARLMPDTRMGIVPEGKAMSVPEGITSRQVRELIDKNSPGESLDFDALRSAIGGDSYKLTDYDISKINLGDLSVDASKAMPSKGPIVIGKDGNIIDGRHRAALSKSMGDTHIKAYVPVGDNVGGAMIQRPKTEFEILHDTAQRNAALPVEQGGLGLPANNTYIDRANAPGMYPTDAYHATNVEFDSFDPSKTKFVNGVFTSTDPSGASAYVEAKNAGLPTKHEGGFVMPLRINNEKSVTPEYFNLNNVRSGLAEGNNVVGGDVVVIPNAKNIRSRFAAFDPFRRHEADILAGVGVGGMLDPQAIAEALRQQDRK